MRELIEDIPTCEAPNCEAEGTVYLVSADMNLCPGHRAEAEVTVEG